MAVFCGSSLGRRPEYLEAVVTLGRELAGRGLRTVYGGARVGTMGALADAVVGAGGEIIGVIPHHLMDTELPMDGGLGHPHLTEFRIVDSMHERKATMAELADAFVAAPGGFGTLEEWAEITTWAYLGLHAKPIVLLNVAGYYDPLLAFLDHAVAEGFLRADQRALVRSADDPSGVLDALT